MRETSGRKKESWNQKITSPITVQTHARIPVSCSLGAPARGAWSAKWPISPSVRRCAARGLQLSAWRLTRELTLVLGSERTLQVRITWCDMMTLASCRSPFWSRYARNLPYPDTCLAIESRSLPCRLCDLPPYRSWMNESRVVCLHRSPAWPPPPSPATHGKSRSAPSKQHHAESTSGVQNLFSLLEHQLFHVVHRSSRLQTLSCFTCQRTSAAFSSTTWVLSNGRVNFENHNLNKLIAKNERYVTDLSLLREFWWKKYTHVILTAEADSVSTDAKYLLEDYGLVGCHSNKGNFMSVHARIDCTGYVRLMWESNDEEDKGSNASIF